MKAPNRLERLIVEAAQDVSKRLALCTALLEEPLWFPVNYRADQPALAKPGPGDPVSFCLGQDDEGPFVPVYTSRSMLKDCLARFHQRHGLATMPGLDLCVMLGGQNHPVHLNPGAKYTLKLARDAVQRLATGEYLSDAEESTQCQATFRNLTPDLLPPGLLEKITTECQFEPGIHALWLMDLDGTVGPADLRHLHVVVWLRDFRRTPTDNLKKILRVACRGYEPEMIRLDEANYGEQLGTLRTLPPVYSHPPAAPM